MTRILGLGHHREAPPPDFREAIREIVTPLREQLDVANQHADSERARADRAEQRADEALAAERRNAQEVRDLREQLSDAHGAERIARDEAAGLRARLDQLQSRGLWARLPEQAVRAGR